MKSYVVSLCLSVFLGVFGAHNLSAEEQNANNDQISEGHGGGHEGHSHSHGRQHKGKRTDQAKHGGQHAGQHAGQHGGEHGEHRGARDHNRNQFQHQHNDPWFHHPQKPQQPAGQAHANANRPDEHHDLNRAGNEANWHHHPEHDWYWHGEGAAHPGYYADPNFYYLNGNPSVEYEYDQPPTVVPVPVTPPQTKH